MKEFCAEGGLTNPKCYKVENFDFNSEENIFDILLDVFKSELPAKMADILDCQNKPMIIHEEHIDLLPSEGTPRFELILNPFGDIPTYSEALNYREVEYTFELLLTVANQVARCVTWELLRFKNAVESLLIGAEFQIDGYNSVYIEPKGFRYFVPEVDGGNYRRQGAYRFTVTVTQYRTN